MTQRQRSNGSTTCHDPNSLLAVLKFGFHGSFGGVGVTTLLSPHTLSESCIRTLFQRVSRLLNVLPEPFTSTCASSDPWGFRVLYVFSRSPSTSGFAEPFAAPTFDGAQA